MTSANFDFSRLLSEHLETMESVKSLEPVIVSVADRMVETLRNGGKICWMGNGGSASDAQHLAAELVGRFQKHRRGLASIAFTTNSSVLTAVSNDYGYEEIFARQVEALCGPLDLVVGVSTSGNSPNVLRGISMAREMDVFTVGLAGNMGGKLKAVADVTIALPTSTAARAQEAHIFIGHCLCEAVESSF